MGNLALELDAQPDAHLEDLGQRCADQAREREEAHLITEARAMVAGLERSEEPRKILEVGPGTGSFTREIISLLGAEDELHLCEVNHDLLTYLKKKIEDDPRFSSHKEQIFCHGCPVQDLDGDIRYHHIVSGLPFNNFQPEVVEEILDKYKQQLLPKGTLRFFEYLAIRQAKMPLVGREERSRLNNVASIVGDLCHKHAIRKTVVWLNLPPAVAWCLRFDSPSDE